MFSIAFAGAFVIDTYKTIIKECQKILITRIFISALFSGIFMASLAPVIMSWFPKLHFQIFIIIQFIFGGVGFESIGACSSLGKLNKSLDTGLKSIYNKAVTINKICKVLKEEDQQNKIISEEKKEETVQDKNKDQSK
jgi:hypothetical protein